MSSSNIKFLNHSSVLIQCGDSFVMTDPWYDKPSFGSWLSTPPCSIHPAYLVALSKAVEDFILVVSHGHDDHLDDNMIALFPKDTKVLIPKYKSVGLRKRLERAGLKNIYEANSGGLTLGNFTFKTYINPDICPDDALITIRTEDKFIVHANDNWQELEKDVIQDMIDDSSDLIDTDKLYMSQCNLADGWPELYRNYTEEEKSIVQDSRIENIIKNTLYNASLIGCKSFLNYAGHASAFVANNPGLRDRTSYVSNNLVESIASKFNIGVNILNMVPGDSFDFVKITKQFDGINISDVILKESSWEFYEKYNVVSACDSYEPENAHDRNLEEKLNLFLNGFNKFVSSRVEKSRFNHDIIDFKVTIRSETVESTTIFSNYSNVNKCAIFYVNDIMLQKLLNREINWENLYIGYQAEVETCPMKTNIRAVIRWLASYGYVYQVRGVTNV